MDPKKIYELILSGREDSGNEINYGFDVTEIIEEFTGIDKAMKELQRAVKDFDNQTGFDGDFTEIDRKLHEKKMALEFEGVDAAYEM